MTDPEGWQVEPRDIPAEIDEWWRWQLESEREIEPFDVDDRWFRRVVTIDPSPYL